MRGHGIHAVLLGTLAFAAMGLVVAVIGVALVPSYTCSKADKARNHDIPNIMNGLKTYRLQTGSYPSAKLGLQALVDRRVLDRIPHDPWQHPYRYQLDGKPVITTYGADGLPGGDDLDADNDLSLLR